MKYFFVGYCFFCWVFFLINSFELGVCRFLVVTNWHDLVGVFCVSFE